MQWKAISNTSLSILLRPPVCFTLYLYLLSMLFFAIFTSFQWEPRISMSSSARLLWLGCISDTGWHAEWCLKHKCYSVTYSFRRYKCPCFLGLSDTIAWQNHRSVGFLKLCGAINCCAPFQDMTENICLQHWLGKIW